MESYSRGGGKIGKEVIIVLLGDTVATTNT
jgi:hypothetical protein